MSEKFKSDIPPQERQQGIEQFELRKLNEQEQRNLKIFFDDGLVSGVNGIRGQVDDPEKREENVLRFLAEESRDRFFAIGTNGKIRVDRLQKGEKSIPTRIPQKEGERDMYGAPTIDWGKPAVVAVVQCFGNELGSADLKKIKARFEAEASADYIRRFNEIINSNNFNDLFLFQIPPHRLNGDIPTEDLPDRNTVLELIASLNRTEGPGWYPEFLTDVETDRKKLSKSSRFSWGWLRKNDEHGDYEIGGGYASPGPFDPKYGISRTGPEWTKYLDQLFEEIDRWEKEKEQIRAVKKK